jgi:hypothetical protein
VRPASRAVPGYGISGKAIMSSTDHDDPETGMKPTSRIEESEECPGKPAKVFIFE